jgi:hypothetical protein
MRAILKIAPLTATLAHMHRVWNSLFGGSRVRQRSRVVVLSLALCLWMVAFATHIHTDNNELSQDAPSNACSFCLSLPSGATPPAYSLVALPQFIATEVVAETVTALVALDVPSSYLSRGPPAR